MNKKENVYCKDCKWVYAWGYPISCKYPKIKNKFRGTYFSSSDDRTDTSSNENGRCPFYKRIWWKIWI